MKCRSMANPDDPETYSKQKKKFWLKKFICPRKKESLRVPSGENEILSQKFCLRLHQKIAVWYKKAPVLF